MSAEVTTVSNNVTTGTAVLTKETIGPKGSEFALIVLSAEYAFVLLFNRSTKVKSLSYPGYLYLVQRIPICTRRLHKIYTCRILSPYIEREKWKSNKVPI